MTDITKLAQSLKAAAENAIGAHERLAAYPYGEIIDISQQEGEQIDIDITDINEFHEEASPTNVLALVEALEKAQQRIDELENDEVRQRLANAEHQLYMAELAKHNLKASRKAQFRKRRAAEKRIAELEAQNEYIRKRYQQLDLLIGKNILVMQAAIIEWQATGDAKNGLAWIYNTLFGPGELPDEAEKDAQAYFDRKYAPLDEELMALHKWFWEQSEAERAAAGIKVEAE
ncbi:ead/Ea22-like family protein [Klebsiella pneumoniae]|uniref:ead/Ea22-like family protein n=1 Tax=Klebsiella pneumoniae TaxID=573 RepID=UPI001F18F061|nr:ead/Ea22-like family protein [Klebsiella pneumoniae]